MLQRGRKSSASTVVSLAATGSRSALNPPTSLTKEEKAAFTDLVASVDYRHLSQADMPLLISYIQASIKARKLARTTDIANWERAVRAQMALARSLRLTVQARVNPKTLTRRLPETPPSFYELMDVDDNDDG
jgi:hypothetical protein